MDERILETASEEVKMPWPQTIIAAAVPCRRGRYDPRHLPMNLRPLPLVAALSLVGASVRADPAGPAPPRAPVPPPLAAPVPLLDEFSPLGLGISLGAAATGVFLFIRGDALLGTPSPSMGPPDRDSVDSRLSRHLYQPGVRHMWWGIPDATGAFVLPLLPVMWYGADWLALSTRGRPLIRDDPNPHHRLFAYLETMGWTYLLTGLVKYTVGRPRPYTEAANNHPDLRRRPDQDNLSFFSGHASVSFAVGAFLAEDVSRNLRRTTLADCTPATRFLLGTLLPYTVGYGVPALVGVSRIADQQHWPTDVAMGAVTGALIANAVYALHFERDGQPRRRRVRGEQARSEAGLRLTFVPQIPTLGWGRSDPAAPVPLGLGYLGRF
jgi:membrane-associated phospholipid phosphatase